MEILTAFDESQLAYSDEVYRREEEAEERRRRAARRVRLLCMGCNQPLGNL